MTVTVQEHITAILDTPVFGGCLYYIQHPDVAAVEDVYGIFSIVGGSTFPTLEGDTDLTRPRIQISVYATDGDTLVAKVAAVKAAMKAANELTETADPDTTATALFSNSASVPVDGFEPDTGRFYSHLDYYCWSYA